MPPIAPTGPSDISSARAPSNDPVNPEALSPIVALVRENHELLATRYRQEQYRPRTYERLKQRFANLESVEQTDIEEALNWKYGAARAAPDTHAIQSAVRWFAHNRTEAAKCHSWLLLLRTLQVDLPFRTAAFLTHLACPDEVPQIDQYSFLAMRYLLGRSGLPAPLHEMPEDIQDLVMLKRFILALLDACYPYLPDAQYAQQFLMMFGKHLAPPPTGKPAAA